MGAPSADLRYRTDFNELNPKWQLSTKTTEFEKKKENTCNVMMPEKEFSPEYGANVNRNMARAFLIFPLWSTSDYFLHI